MAIQASSETSQNDAVRRDIAERHEKFLLDVYSARQTAIRRARAEGIAIGKARALAREEIKGKIRGKIDMLILILTKRFGTLPEGLTANLKNLTDLSKINQLADIAIDIPALEDFAKNL